VFATDRGGQLLHFDGKTWSPFPSPGEQLPSAHGWGVGAIWGTNDSDLFVVGGGVGSGKIAHYDGSLWKLMWEAKSQTNLAAMWGASATSLYVAGGWNQSGLILHYDGKDWKTTYSSADGELRAIWGRSDTDIYAASTLGALVHFDGASWEVLGSTNANSCYLKGMFGTPDQIFVTSSCGIEHFDGVARGLSYRWLENTSIEALGGCASKDLFAVGLKSSDESVASVLHYDGQDWQPMDAAVTHDLFGTWCIAPDDVYAVGDQSTVLHYDGKLWSGVPLPPSTASFAGVWASSAKDVFVVGDQGTVLRYDGVAWSQQLSGTDLPLRAVSGTGPKDVFAAGDGVTLHYDGSNWSQLPSANVQSVWAVDSNNVFMVTQGGIGHFDGAAWSEIYSAPVLPPPNGGLVGYSAIWGSSASDIWAVGTGGAITHFDGATFDTALDVNSALYSVWGNSPSEAVAAGASFILRYRCPSPNK
jgi:hypothetical protein